MTTFRAHASIRSLLALLLTAGCGGSDKANGPPVAGAPVRLGFQLQPPSVVANGVNAAAVRVAVLDANGNVVTNATSTVTLALAGGPAPGTLGGITSIAPVGGVATFPDWTVAPPGSGYTLTASATGLTGATSTSFTVKFAIAAVSSGVEHTCALTTAGAAWCWGYNADGQVGDSSTTQRFTPVPVAGGLSFASISVGETHTCALTAAGVAWCWGSAVFGLLGTGSNSPNTIPTPVAVAGGLRFTSLRAGGGHTCGTTSTGVLYCWGVNGSGQLGTGDSVARNVPVAVMGGSMFSAVSASRHFSESTCGISTSGTVQCWGSNSAGQFGNGTRAGNPLPVLMPGTRTYTDITLGDTHACGLDTSGDVTCWGQGDLGKLGNGTNRDSLLPSPVAGGLKFASISAGYASTCGVTVIGAAGYCWGGGPLGNGTTGLSALSPSPVSGNLSFRSISVGGSHACGVTAERLLYCWGINNFGQRGDGASGPTNVLVPLVVGP